jgi:23S rRNA pseudouridine1911/1915/1917 synthase
MTHPSSPPPWTVHLVTPEEAGQTLSEILRGPMGVSGRRLQRLTRSRGIRVNGRPAHTSRRLAPGDRVEVKTLDGGGKKDEAAPRGTPPPRPGAPGAPAFPAIRPVLEDPTVLVLDKPPGLAVHPTGRIRQGTLVQHLALRDAALGLRTGIHPVHRLDRDTSGLLLIARTPGAHAQLDRDLREGRIHRRYLALASGTPDVPGGLIDLPLGREPGGGSRRVVRTDGDEARTRIRVVEAWPGATLLDVTLETGRTHQIRAHLAHLGCPLLGDRLYGGPSGPASPRTALHAVGLSFPHPATGSPVELEAPLPPELQALLESVRRS